MTPLLTGCIHAPNLRIADVTVLGHGDRGIRYSVAVENAKRYWPFSRCRTSDARGEVRLRGTLSPTRSPGTVPAGSQVVVSETDRFVRDALPAGKTAHELVDADPGADAAEHPFLVVELQSDAPRRRCAVLQGRKAVRIPEALRLGD